MKVFHLSHTDFDGYGAQFITKHYFKDIEFFNSNYGKEIDQKIDIIVSKLPDEKSLFLITDLNLTLKQCESLKAKISGKNSKILLLDHHQTGLESAKNNDWYFLDNSQCATAITHKFFSDVFENDAGLEKFKRVVNAVDIWLKDEDEFEVGKVCLAMIANAKEINKVLFPKEHTEYIFYILSRANEFFDKPNAHILLDEALHFIKKDFFRGDKENDSFGNLVSNYVVNLLSLNSQKFAISYGDYKGILTYNIGNTSVIGNDFLVKNSGFDFFMDISSKKTISLRANNKIDVSKMASDIFGGGGHANASGGVMPSFKEAYAYEAVKDQVQAYINQKLNETK